MDCNAAYMAVFLSFTEKNSQSPVIEFIGRIFFYFTLDRLNNASATSSVSCSAGEGVFCLFLVLWLDEKYELTGRFLLQLLSFSRFFSISISSSGLEALWPSANVKSGTSVSVFKGRMHTPLEPYTAIF